MNSANVLLVQSDIPFHYPKTENSIYNILKEKGVTYSERSKRLTEINVYITNIPCVIVPMKHIHDI